MSEPRPAVAVLRPVVLLAGALLALGVARWWVAGVAAPLLAAAARRARPRLRPGRTCVG